MRLPVLFLGLTAAGSLLAADAKHGEMVIESQGCLGCHTVRGQGLGHEALRPAKDLSGRLTANYTVPSLASVLWNHQPAMWDRLTAQRTQLPPATEADWQDLFAYLYSLQFEDSPGDASRGQAAFTRKGCSTCHGPQADAALKAPPVKEWDSVYDPIDLVYEMWTHASAMYARSQGVKVYKGLPKVSTRDLMDLTAYAQSVQKLSPNSSFSLPPAADGRMLYEARCGATCHAEGTALENRLKNATFMDIAAQLWNHAPDMAFGPATSKEEMGQILSYVWQLQYAGPPGSGNSVNGNSTFRAKGCISCHKDDSGAPRSPRPGQFTQFSMVAMSWGHGRQMHAQIVARGAKWPELSPKEMADLAAYLNTLRF